MHPDLMAAMERTNEDELQRRASRAARQNGGAETARRPADIAIRAATGADGPAISALAALDGAAPPQGEALVAELDGTVAAALPLDGGRPVADPFQHTDEALDLLVLRYTQLKREQSRRQHKRLAWLAPAALRRFV